VRSVGGTLRDFNNLSQPSWFQPPSGLFLLEKSLDARCKFEGCPHPVTGRQIYCTDRCRQRATVRADPQDLLW
jgi:hypothetical protein